MYLYSALSAPFLFLTLGQCLFMKTDDKFHQVIFMMPETTLCYTTARYTRTS